jgi:hypothetical protein
MKASLKKAPLKLPMDMPTSVSEEKWNPDPVLHAAEKSGFQPDFVDRQLQVWQHSPPSTRKLAAGRSQSGARIRVWLARMTCSWPAALISTRLEDC